ncbi:MAG: GNAT family N-acetyltransferase, partial [Pseudomonadota bacterium]
MTVQKSACPEIREGMLPGVLGAIADLHMAVYPAEHAVAGQFEADQLADLADFAARHDEARDALFSAWDSDGLIGCTVVDGTDTTGPAGWARLRWVLVAHRARGSGLGRRLMARALETVDRAPARGLWLTTFSGLDAARRLYEANGFALVEAWPDTRWGRPLTVQRFE